jgi:hypothetical protein
MMKPIDTFEDPEQGYIELKAHLENGQFDQGFGYDEIEMAAMIEHYERYRVEQAETMEKREA